MTDAVNVPREWLKRLAAAPSSDELLGEEIGEEYDIAAHCVTLAECPPGLFFWNGSLGFKSEYGAMEPLGSNPTRNEWKVGNRADAYCADSGEYFWGGTSNHDDRAKLLVYPISAETVAMVASHGPDALTHPAPASDELLEEERELDASDYDAIDRSLKYVGTVFSMHDLHEALTETMARMHSGYDWNSDPDGITLKQGDAIRRYETHIAKHKGPQS